MCLHFYLFIYFFYFLNNKFGSKESACNMFRVLTKQKTDLKIVHINAQSLCNKIDEFRYIFVTSGVDMCL